VAAEHRVRRHLLVRPLLDQALQLLVVLGRVGPKPERPQGFAGEMAHTLILVVQQPRQRLVDGPRAAPAERQPRRPADLNRDTAQQPLERRFVIAAADVTAELLQPRTPAPAERPRRFPFPLLRQLLKIVKQDRLTHWSPRE